MFEEDTLPVWVFFAALVAVTALAIIVTQYKEEKRWEAYVQAHNCRIVETDNSDRFQKTTWQCPDGSVHIRR